MTRRLTKSELAASLRAAGRTPEEIAGALGMSVEKARGHTPGPWSVNLDRPFSLGGDCVEVVALRPDGMVERGVASLMLDTDAYPHGQQWLEDAANCYLVAAGPDLLAACEADAAFHEHFDKCDDCEIDDWHERVMLYCAKGGQLRETADTLRTAAILKARGGQQP